MKKFGILAGLAFVALLLGMAGTAIRSDEAQASPTDVLTVQPGICAAIAAAFDWDDDGDTDDDADDFVLALAACSALSVPANLAAVAEALGGDADDPDTWAAVAAFGADQLREDTGFTWVLAFVTTIAPVTFVAEEGALLPHDMGPPETPGTWLCDTNAEDGDCAPGAVAADGVVVAGLSGATADLGAADLEVEQQGRFADLEYLVVGAPEDIVVIAFPSDTVIESAIDCTDLDVGDFEDEVEAPEVTGVIATVTDDDGTELTGVPVEWLTSDDDVATLAEDTTITLALDAGTIAVNLVCGQEPGTADITGGVNMDADADLEIDDSVEITVIGEPAEMTLVASPSSITCDGVNSSTVTATLVDADGNPVVAGIGVRFDVVALGIADPINTTTDATGVASSDITPLSGVSAGVVVSVSAPDFDLEGSVRIDCTPPVPTVAPPPPPTAVPPPIVPPPTGDGGYLD